MSKSDAMVHHFMRKIAQEDDYHRERFFLEQLNWYGHSVTPQELANDVFYCDEDFNNPHNIGYVTKSLRYSRIDFLSWSAGLDGIRMNNLVTAIKKKFRKSELTRYNSYIKYSKTKFYPEIMEPKDAHKEAMGELRYSCDFTEVEDNTEPNAKERLDAIRKLKKMYRMANHQMLE
jgi:hypothetical protein